MSARPFFPSPGLAGQRSRAWPAPARADGRWGEDGHEATAGDVARALVMAKRRTAGCPRVGVVPATAASLTSCSYGLTHPRTAAAPLLLGVLVKVPPTLPPAGFGRGHTPIADALPHRYGRCDLAPLPVALATVADRTQTIPRRPLGPAATQPGRAGAVASLVKVRYTPDDETLVIALIEDIVRPAPSDATRPEDGFEPALFDCEGIAEHDSG